MKVVTFGELLLCLSPDKDSRMQQADRFVGMFGGSEAVTAICLANFGVSSAFVTRLPANPIGCAAKFGLERLGTDVSRIAQGEGRLGICYYEKDAQAHARGAFLDREGSAFALSCSADYDWDEIFSDADWFHFTGGSLSSGSGLCALCHEAVRKARARGVTVSCEVDSFSSDKDGEALRNMREICRFVDVCIAGGSGNGAERIAGADEWIGAKGERTEILKRMAGRFGFKVVAALPSFEISPAGESRAALIAGDQVYFSRNYAFEGYGADGLFSGGLIFSMLSGWNEQKIIEFSAAAASLWRPTSEKQAWVSAEQALSLADGTAENL